MNLEMKTSMHLTRSRMNCRGIGYGLIEFTGFISGFHWESRFNFLIWLLIERNIQNQLFLIELFLPYFL